MRSYVLVSRTRTTTACGGIQTDSENSNLRGPLRTDLHFSVLDCAGRFEIFVAVCSYGSAIPFASLLLFAVVRSFRPIVNKDTVLLSILTSASTAFWILGLEYVSTSESAVLSYTMPLIAIPLSSLILSEKASHKVWTGAAVGFLGVLVYSFVVFENRTLSALGAVLTLLNAFFWAMYTIYYRKLKNQDPTATVATSLLFGALLFFFISPLDYSLHATLNFWLDLAYLSVLSAAVSLLLWNALARLNEVGKTSTLIYSTPLAVTAVQYVETSSMPPPASLIGICLMIFGIYLSQL